MRLEYQRLVDAELDVLKVRLPEQAHVEAAPSDAVITVGTGESVRVYREIAVAKFTENGGGSQVPARPRERSISVDVSSIDASSGFQKQIDATLAAVRRGAM